MIGPLDALRVVNELLAARAIFPDRNGGVDMFEQLRTTTGLSTWAAAGVLAALRYLWQITFSVPSVARLNREVKKACRTPWKCHLPITSRWLVAVPEFRNSCLELCYYLDQV